MYSDYEEVYFENVNVVTRTINEIILESLIFGFIKSNKIWIWSNILHQNVYLNL